MSGTVTAPCSEVITRLSDDEVKPGETEKLLIALGRAKIIDEPTFVTLLGRYFDEMAGDFDTA